MEKIEQNIIYHALADKYLKQNPERFDTKEKHTFITHLDSWLNDEDNAIDDDVVDFLVYLKLHNKDRHEDFAKYILSKYKPMGVRKVLDVGAGRMCKLSTALSKGHMSVSSMDPIIRLKPQEAKARGISSISLNPFVCDEYSKVGEGTSVAKYDLIVGLEPCEATEHIIRQSLKHDKLFDVRLCYTNHSALNGTKFRTPEEWYEYLFNISHDVDIARVGKDYHARNAGVENYMELDK